MASISVFSKVLKQKKIIFFIFLVLFGIGMALPKTAHADWLDDGATWVNQTFAGAGDALKGVGLDVIAGAGKLIVAVSMSLVYIGKTLFDGILSSEYLQKAITKEPIVIQGWTVVRDFANMFIVLGFVVIGISTILRIREYEAQKLLPTLIIVALLINFSLLICGIIIDGTNITMNYFLSGPINVGAGGVTNPITKAVTSDSIYKNIDRYLNPASINWKAFAAIVASASLYAGIAAMLFIIYAMLFLFRYVALMCLVILSPLAFVCYVFPATKPIWNKWWSQFTQWAIMGIPATFFIWLSSQMAVETFRNGTPASPIAFFIPVAFMYFAYTLTFQISAIGSAGAIGLATGAMGFAAGASKWAGGKAMSGAGTLAANSTPGKAITSAGGRFLERVGLRAQGRTASLEAQRLEDPRKRIGAIQSNTELAKIANGRAFTERAMRDKAVAIERLYKEGKSGLITDQKAAVAFASSYGVQHDVFEKGDPRNVIHNTNKVNEVLKLRGISRPTAAQRTAVENELVADAYKKADVKTLREMPSTRTTAAGIVIPGAYDMNFVNNISHKKLNKVGEELSIDKVAQLKDLLPDLRTRRDSFAPTIGNVAGAAANPNHDPQRFTDLDRKISAIEHM